jgi:hypothetical protein
MKKLLPTLFTLLSITSASADEYIDNEWRNSYFRNVLAEHYKHHPSGNNATVQPASPYTHNSQKGNSLARAVLAKQKADSHLVITSFDQIDFSANIKADRNNNSLFGSALRNARKHK